MSQKFAAKVLTFYDMRNTRVTEYLRTNRSRVYDLIPQRIQLVKFDANTMTEEPSDNGGNDDTGGSDSPSTPDGSTNPDDSGTGSGSENPDDSDLPVVGDGDNSGGTGDDNSFDE